MPSKLLSAPLADLARQAKRAALAAAALAFLAAFGASHAQAQKAESQPGAPVVLELKGGEKSDDIARMVEALGKGGKSVTVRIADPAAAATASPSAAAATPQEAPASNMMTPGADMSGFASLLMESIMISTPGMRALPSLFTDLAAGFSADEAPAARFLGAALAALLVALALAYAAHRFASRILGLGASRCAGWTTSRLKTSLRRLLADGAAAVIAIVAFRLVANALAPASAGAIQILTTALMAVALYLIAGRFLLAPGEPDSRLLPLPRADFHFRVLLVFVLAGQFIFLLVSLADYGASNRVAVAGLFFIVSTIATLFKIGWFWIARHDIETLIARGGDKPDEPSIARRIVAASTIWLYIAASVALWIVARAAVMLPEGARWARAAGATQFIIILVPVIAVGVIALLRDMHRRTSDGAQPSPLRLAFGAVGERAAGGAVWLGGIYILTRMWGDFFMESGSRMIVAQISNLVLVAGVLVAGYLITIFMKTLFDAHAPKKLTALPGDEDNTHDQVQTRIGSVLPILRGFTLGAIIGLTALVALSKLGVDIGPLLAGFGILGLAISFGSQALVRDIVSGLFFMVEDAFRVGEYIDTGKLRGTVEKISLRSVQLRHQSGQIHTIPFGQIASVTNASRDWATVKFNIKLDRGTDIEKARKAIKKTGLAMLEDPEIGKDFILPLKMQGVSDIIETGIIVRLKFTAKPTMASQLQRESLKRVHRALNEAGVAFASNAVIVNRSMDDLAAAAASVNMAQRAANAPAA